MNWFRFLKNKSGKLKFGLAHLVAIGGVGMVLATTAFNAEKEAVQEQKVRSITSLAQGSSYGGMRQTQGGLTSINVGNAAGYDGVANSEERARIEAARSGGDFGLNAADNMDGRLASRFSGRAAETSETEGLGMGRNATDIVEAPTRGAAADITPGSMGDRTGRTGRGRYGAGDTSSATTQTLSTASMARASGSGISASYGGGSSGSSSGGAGGSGSRGGRSSGVGEGYHLSGAIPSGTNIVSMSGAGGRGASQFTPGAANARVGRGSHSNAVGDALKDISKRSADAAANKYRSANEGARAFLSGSQNSGGIGMDTLAAAEASTDDFHTPEKVSTGNLNKKMDDETARQKEKNKDNNLCVGYIGFFFDNIFKFCG